MAQIKLGGGRNKGKSREEGEKEKLTFREEGEIGLKSREREKLAQKVGRRKIYPHVPPPSLMSVLASVRLVSSAYILGSEYVRQCGKSLLYTRDHDPHFLFLYIKNRRGPKIVPWGTIFVTRCRDLLYQMPF